MCHVHHAVLNNLHLCNLFQRNILLVKFGQHGFVDLYNNRIEFRQQFFHQMAIPLFEGFRHNRVVGVAENLLCNGECISKCPLAVIQHQQANQFRNGDDRMGVVQLNSQFISQIVQCAIGCLVLFQNIRQGSGTEEILLL